MGFSDCQCLLSVGLHDSEIAVETNGIESPVWVFTMRLRVVKLILGFIRQRRKVATSCNPVVFFKSWKS